MLEELAAQIGERMRIEEINYPQYPSQILEPMEFTEKVDDIRRYSLLAAEFGYNDEARQYLNEFEESIRSIIGKVNDLLDRS